MAMVFSNWKKVKVFEYLKHKVKIYKLDNHEKYYYTCTKGITDTRTFDSLDEVTKEAMITIKKYM